MIRTTSSIATILAALAIFVCCSSDDSVAPVTGMVQGSVSVQPLGDLEGVEIIMTGAANHTTTSDSDGRFEFLDLSEGAYTVAMSNPPAHVVFEHSTYDFTISRSGQVFETDFFGTLQVSGNVRES